MKNKMVFSLILTGVLFLAGNSGNVSYSQTIQNKQDTIKSVQYTCPMHPDVVQDMPGKCPKCGMQLVKKQNQNGGDLHNNDTTGMKKMMMVR